VSSETPPGVTVVGELGRGAQTVVHRVRRDGREWAMKIFPDVRGDDALRREAALLAWINHPGLPQVHEVGVAGRRPYLIMELIEGRSLAEVLRVRPLTVGGAIRLGIEVAAALGALHRVGLVHRDVKPHNIMIEPDGTARLIDLGMAGRAAARPDAEVAGTPLYSAPEQSGTLNRPVDARTDLYALGAVLHECLTGVPPFTAPDVGELLRLHAAAPPPDPRAARPEVPGTLADVVAKLLAKDPDDRYQTGAGLAADLGRLAADPWTAFPLGAAAGTDAETTPLTGRDREFGALVERWRQAAAGRGGFAVVEGAHGAGKSRLLRELSHLVLDEGTTCLMGACPEDPVPLAPLRAALGDRLLAPHTDDPEAFTLAVANALVDLARAGPVLLCLDDAHRVDEATLAVLRLLAAGTGEVPLLVVLGREAGAPPLPPIVAEHADPTVSLGPLDAVGAAELVAALAHGRNVDAELLDRLAARGGTTPLEIREYLAAVVDGGALVPYWGQWRLDTAGLDRIALPGDLRTLVLRRLDGLGGRCRTLLTAAAVIGTRFPVALAVAASGVGPALARRLLAEAAGHGAIRHHDDGYAFAHEQLRHALLEAADPELLRDVHQRLAERLDSVRLGRADQTKSHRPGLGVRLGRADQTKSHRPTDGDPAHAYALARHYLHGHVDRDPAKVVEVCRAAGALALADNAPAEAVALLEPAYRLAENLAATPPASPVGAVGELLGTAYRQVGHLTQALRTLRAALPGADGPVARARILLQICRVHGDVWDADAALSTMDEGLAEVGRRLPRNQLWLLLTTVSRFVLGLAIERTRIGFGTATGEVAARLRLEAQFYNTAGMVASLAMKPALSVALMLRSLYPLTRLGATPDYAYTRTDIAGLVDMLTRRRGGYERAARVAAETGGARLVAYVTQMERTINHIMGRGRPRAILADAFEARHLVGAGRFVLGLGGTLWLQLLAGFTRDAYTLYQEGKARLAAADLPEHSLIVAGASIAAALGRVAEADAALRRAEANPAAFRNPSARVTLLLARTQVAVEQRDLGTEFDETVTELEALEFSPKLLLMPMRAVYVYAAYGRLEQCRAATPERSDAALAAARRVVATLRRVAGSKLLKAHAQVATANLHLLAGDPERALTTLSAAEPILRAADAPLASYEAARLRARVLHQLGHEAEAAVSAAGAAVLANRYEWPHRMLWIRDEFGESAALSGTRPSRAEDTSISAGAYQQRLDAVAALSLAASRIVDPAELTRVALDETIRLLSAERAYLFLTDDRGRLVPHLGRDAAGADLTELVGYGSTLVERTRQSRESLVVTGTDEGAALGSHSAVAHGLRSIMVAPLLHDDRLLGVLYLDSRVAKGIFNAADVGILAAITTHVAAALETARAAQLTVDVRAARLERDLAETLRTAMEHLSATLDPADVLDRLRGTVVGALHADRSGLAVLDDGKVLVDTAVIDPDPVLASMLASAAPVGSGPPPEVFADLAGAAWLAVPLRSRDAPVGLVFVSADQPGAFTGAQRQLAAVLAGQGMIAYENARLFKEVERLALTDGLTGLLNRRHFFQLADRELAVARRRRSTLTALMLDVDHFKQVNDRYGHPVGDQVIVAVARRLAAATRKTDLLGRYGGEEFVILLPDTAADGARILAERVRAGLADHPVDTDAGPLRVTASIGLADGVPDDTEPGTLLARADEALYRAKQAGRNRVVHYSDC
jgi:eukaryotic-like serine/threonine-protein kinase